MALLDYLDTRSKNHIIFDFDNTIVSLQIDWSRWFEGIEPELKGLDEEIFDAKREGKINLSQLQNLYVEKFGDSVRDKIIAHNQKFEKTANGYEINQKIIEDIRALKAHKYLWTSNTRSTVVPILNELGLIDSFEKMITRSDVSFVKPEIEGFEFIYDPEIAKDEYLLVGDSGSDEKAASKAGIDFYKVTYFGDFSSL